MENKECCGIPARFMCSCSELKDAETKIAELKKAIDIAWRSRDDMASEATRQRLIARNIYNGLHAYYQDLIPPGGSISRSELLARLEMLASNPRQP